MANWYSQNPEELNKILENFLSQKTLNLKAKDIHGLIVPHAGYEFSGAIAGKAFALLKNKEIKKAVVLGPSHYESLSGVATTNLPYAHTPIKGEMKFFNTGFFARDISQEHSISNQYPFLQKLGFKEVMPLMISQITNKEAKEIAEKISKIDAVYITSTKSYLTAGLENTDVTGVVMVAIGPNTAKRKKHAGVDPDV